MKLQKHHTDTNAMKVQKHHTDKPQRTQTLRNCTDNNTIIVMYSFSKLEHIAHYKAKTQSKQTSICMYTPTHTYTHTHKYTYTPQVHTHTHRVNRIAWRGEIEDDLTDVSVFDDLTLQRRLFQTDGAA